MFATDEWPRVAFGLTRWVRPALRPAMLAAGGHRAECRSIADHATAHRWLERLGFVREAVLPDCGKNRECFHQYAWRLSDRAPPMDGKADVQSAAIAIGCSDRSRSAAGAFATCPRAHRSYRLTI